MYCPDVTASAYLRRIRQTCHSSSRYSNSFIHSLSRSDLHISSDDTSCLDDTFQFRRQHKVQRSPASPLPLPSTKRKVVDVSNNNVNRHSKRRKLSQFENSSTPGSDVAEMRFPVLFNAVPIHDSSGSAFGHSINEESSWPFPKENTQPSSCHPNQLHRT
jgi:hypothetical protein